MQILAIEHEIPGVEPAEFARFSRDEALRAWELNQAGVIRELYYRADRTTTVLMLESGSLEEAQAALASLPLVREGLIRFELIPLAPYPGFSRLFAAA